jgi:23S rRNA (cytidine1920-2'-O)/16S rRNA (cytidine1409-2'-O)-methyltransferase
LNVRNISSEHIKKHLDLAVFDTSFISLKQVIPPVLPFLGKTPRILALIKPQFEVAREKVSPGGIVRDKQERLNAIEMICQFGQDLNLRFRGYVPSEIKGAMGNQEYLIYFQGKLSE